MKRRKSEGNDLFSAGSYALAAGRYKAALDAMGHGTGGGGRGKPPPRGQTELVAMWAQLNLNIALCRVRTGELKAAERDATRVLEAVEEVGLAVAERGKALYRRATVRIAQANLIQDEIAAGGGGGSSGGGGGGGSSSLSGAVKLLRAGCDDLRGALTLMPTDDTVGEALAGCETRLKQLLAERGKEKAAAAAAAAAAAGRGGEGGGGGGGSSSSSSASKAEKRARAARKEKKEQRSGRRQAGEY